MEEHLQEIVQLSLGSTPEKMLEKALQACIKVSGASGGSILGEEGPWLRFLFSNVSRLIGVRVPFDSIAGVSARKGVIIYTYAPKDLRHFNGIDKQMHGETQYLLSIPIPAIHQSAGQQDRGRHAGVLQLLFEHNILPHAVVDEKAREFEIDRFKEYEVYANHLKPIFLFLPNVMFGMEVIKLRQTSYQAIHELKNKLISAISWLDYLKADIREQSPGLLDSKSISEDMELTDSAIREGTELAKTYLAFTAIYEPHYVHTDVNTVLKETAASAAAYAKESGAAGLRVELDLAAGIPDRELDAGKLKMAFFNLCKNAIEAMAGQERPEEHVLSIGSRLEGGSIILSVKDNGPGMPNEIADNLFIPFRTRKEGGTGLGLTITKKIIDIHGGEIHCRTGDDGTEFTVTI